ncbi:hypothetical protein BJV82DRAFT_367035 [Fennellomyces sp. T-0311]|nr:hypothetical protein BJV82DRAFT_367035 [Fennellomyces sp. T-0311]
MVFKWFSGTFIQSASEYNSTDSAPIAESTSHHEFGFMTALPSDLIPEVLSYLDQSDSLECMAVCRYWYDAIPQYAQNIWKEVHFRTRDAYMAHQRRERCLGRHVKGVVLEPPESSFQVEEQEVHILIQKVLEYGCTNITSLELLSCTTTDQAMFVESLKPLARCLTHMKMSSHLSQIDILHILYKLPNLTHFTYQYSYGICRNVSTVLSSAIPSDYYAKITYLWLEVEMTKGQKEAILKRCPDLRSFIDINRGVETTSAIELDSLFTWCPRINFLETNLFSQHQNPDAYAKDLPGLRLYNTSASYGFDQIVRHLTRNQDTLEFLSIFKGRTSDDWSRAFQSLRLPKLRTLVSVLNYFSADSLISLLNHCPALEKLKLDCPHPRLILDLTSIQSFHIMHHIQYLQCGGIYLDDGLSLLTILERLPSLQHLFIYRSSIFLAPSENFEGLRRLKFLGMHRISWKCCDRRNTAVAIAQFFRCLTNNSTLESIQLAEVTMIQCNALLAIARIASLKCLDVQLDTNLSSEELLEFIIALRETVINTLKFRCMRPFPSPILNALAELPHLSMFCARPNPQARHYITFVDKDGLLRLLSKSPKLVTVRFLDSTVVKDGAQALTQSQIYSLISRQTSQYNVSRARSEGWNMQVGDHSDDTILRCLTVRCADKDNLSVDLYDPFA